MILVYPLVGAILVFATGQLSTSTAVIAAVSAVAGALIVGLAVAALRSERGTLARRRLRPHRRPGRPALPPEPAGLERGGSRPGPGGAARPAPAALAEAHGRDARQPAECLPGLRALPAGGRDLVREPPAERGVPRLGDRARPHLLAAHSGRDRRRRAGDDRHARRLRRLAPARRGGGAALPRIDRPPYARHRARVPSPAAPAGSRAGRPDLAAARFTRGLPRCCSADTPRHDAPDSRATIRRRQK